MAVQRKTKTTAERGAPSPAALARAKFFFLCGDDEPAIEKFKSEIVSAHLSPDNRDTNYLEIGAESSPPRLSRVLGDLLAELSTTSFLPDVERVVVLYPVQDFYEAKRGSKSAAKGSEREKTTPSEVLANFIEQDLPRLSSVLIIIAPEDYERFKRVATSNPVVALAQRMGAFHQFREQGVQFAFFDALLARRADEALRLWREWLSRTGNSPKPYVALANQLRLLIQAKTATSGILEKRNVTRDRYIEEFLPKDAERNVFALRPEWRRDKYLRAAGNFSLVELLDAYERLEPLQKYAIPLASDPVVPDRALLAEIWIMELCARAPD
ncbi:MAG: hypothetical protein N2644_03890 [Candidatus Sumerlaea chitinivorans]|jgi:hypothetical protein|nr:hypothetical protein [Candidatus Sumerlaea chitinivorans]